MSIPMSKQTVLFLHFLIFIDLCFNWLNRKLKVDFFSGSWESGSSKHGMNTSGTDSFSSKTICISPFPRWCGRPTSRRQLDQSSELGGLMSSLNTFHSDVWTPAHLGPWGYSPNTETKLMTFIYTYADIFLYVEENHQHSFLKVKRFCIIYFTAWNGCTLM